MGQIMYIVAVCIVFTAIVLTIIIESVKHEEPWAVRYKRILKEVVKDHKAYYGRRHS